MRELQSEGDCVEGIPGYSGQTPWTRRWDRTGCLPETRGENFRSREILVNKRIITVNKRISL